MTDQMTSNQVIERMQEEMDEADRKGVTDLKKKWEVTNPPPKVTWQFYLLAVPLVSVMVLAASRTAFMFYMISEYALKYWFEEGAQTFSVAEAFVALLGIGGLVVAIGIVEGNKTGTCHVPQQYVVRGEMEHFRQRYGEGEVERAIYD